MSLYKYVTADRIDILKNELIRFTQPSALNDPWELKPRTDGLVSDHDLERIAAPLLERDAMVDLLAKALLEISEPLSHITNTVDAPDPPTLEDLRAAITAADAEFPGEMKALVEGVFQDALGLVKGALPLVDISAALDKSVGVLSLTETPDHPLMWSHYTNNHTGFVIEFDPDHEFFFAEGAAAEMGGLHEVHYASQRPKFEVLFDMSMLNASPEQIKEWVDKVFFTKSKDWEYEGEWR